MFQKKLFIFSKICFRSKMVVQKKYLTLFDSGNSVILKSICPARGLNDNQHKID